MAYKRSNKPRKDWYQELTNNVVRDLEKCRDNKVSWRKTWKGIQAGRPYNMVSMTKDGGYKGLNVLILSLKGYPYREWITFKQAKDKGGHVKAGEKGTQITHWSFRKVYERKDGTQVSNPKNTEGLKYIQTIPSLRVHTVFNLAQCEGLPLPEIKYTDDTVIDLDAKYKVANQLVARSQAKINHVKGSDSAFYSMASDEITMPCPEQFETVEHYWSTMFHELVHWTGHGKRLNRDMSGRFGSNKYAMEELVAELGSLFLCAEHGIEGDLQHPQYLSSWCSALRDDKYAIFKVSSLAQKATDYVLNGAVALDDTVAA